MPPSNWRALGSLMPHFSMICRKPRIAAGLRRRRVAAFDKSGETSKAYPATLGRTRAATKENLQYWSNYASILINLAIDTQMADVVRRRITAKLKIGISREFSQLRISAQKL